MLQADPPTRSAAAEMYGAFQTSSAIEDTPPTNSSIYNFPSASQKDDVSGLGGGVAAQRDIAMQQTARNILFYKVAQFLLLMYMVAGVFFPNHHWVEAMMANTHIASQICVLLSGLLTHHRYRAFFAVASTGTASIAEFLCPAARLSYRIYFRQRVLVFLPYYLVAVLWAVPLAMGKNLAWSVRSVLSTVSLTSSLQTMWPLREAAVPLRVVVETIPFALLAQTLVICWLLYPPLCQCILIGRAWLQTRVPPRGVVVTQRAVVTLLAVSAPILVSAVSLLALPTVEGLAVELKDDAVSKDRHSLAGGAAWFVNPLWKFPVFVCGVLVAELIHELRWAQFSSADKPAGDFSFGVRWVLPYVVDALIFPVFCLVAYDPRKVDYKTNAVAHALLKAFGKSGLGLAEWTLQAPWILLPPVCLVLFLFASPFAYRGITWKLVCQDPILAVLPGRTAVALSFVTTLMIHTIPRTWHDEILKGAGLFFILFLWFTPSIAFYYYVYQPWHLWVSLRPLHHYCKQHLLDSEIQMTETQHLTSPIAAAKMPLETRDTLPAEDASPSPRASPDAAPEFPFGADLKVLTSPHYDPFYPKNAEQELRVYRHVASIPSPLAAPHAAHLELWRWVLALFVETQYVH
eukprot:Gregarina_sp_Pseudo_9__4968@NODE_520_length_2654_cov_17_072275_g491_i0_p1_GENE_NODE_520_length_2654_cov_17_072275_g491_i0NODE_520_length_2654_cov_17_072275_g491_i0_p1_ORF_typecomplete_len631_score187_37_NODE_520_length_2654_cov_17_072275_g491_i05722464